MSAKKLGFLVSLISFFANSKLSLAVAPVTNDAGGGGFASLSQLTNVFVNITSIVSTVIGFVLLLMLIRGGIGYITAQGDPKAVASARSTLTWAFIGLLVVLASFLIISLLTGVLGVDLTRFTIPS